MNIPNGIAVKKIDGINKGIRIALKTELKGKPVYKNKQKEKRILIIRSNKQL